MNSIYGEQSEPLILSVVQGLVLSVAEGLVLNSVKDKKIMKKNVRNVSYALSLFVTVS